ncbi:hypothetical protein B188_06730 [Candidatus Brocadiaceae bacterium B188]|jgi:hypothetical protein|nr:hypothetical protein B188_06730 [Candidatus Brocadiaceae bacterium B188]
MHSIAEGGLARGKHSHILEKMFFGDNEAHLATLAFSGPFWFGDLV